MTTALGSLDVEKAPALVGEAAEAESLAGFRERDRALASLLQRVADAEGRGVVILGRDGSVAFASPGARELMAAHLPRPAAAGVLPESLADWVGLWRSPGLEPPPAFVRDGPAGRLCATWLPGAAPPEPDALLLACQPPPPSPASLAALGLSRRQSEVLALVAQGATNGEVAYALGVSPRTVQKHLEHVFDRLGVRTRAAATARALGAIPAV